MGRKFLYFTEQEHRELTRVFCRSEHARNRKRAARDTRVENIDRRIKKAKMVKIERVEGDVIPTPKAPERIKPKKRDFFISVYDRQAGPTLHKVSGYAAEIDGLEIGLHRSGKRDQYITTDILSGCMIGLQCRTLAEVQTVITPDVVTMIKQKHREAAFKPMIDHIREAYASA